MKNKNKFNKIEKRCRDMANDFEIKTTLTDLDIVKFGDYIKKARYNLLMAEMLASKMFYVKKDEYIIVEELLKTIEEYRNHMDNRPIEKMLKGKDSAILNSIFYGCDDYKDCPHITRLLRGEYNE